MSPDEALVNQIVAAVLTQLGSPAETTCADASVAQASSLVPEQAGTLALRGPSCVDLTETVITADLLEQTLNGAMQVRVSPRAVLTPSARDFLRARNIDCVRQNGSPTASREGVCWKALVVQAAPAVLSALDDVGSGGAPWTRELLGTAAEAARTAVSVLCRAEADGVIVFAHDVEAVACRANRNPRVRGAVVADMQNLQSVRRRMGANLVCIRPEGKSYFDLRNLLRALTAHGPPQVPPDWVE